MIDLGLARVGKLLSLIGNPQFAWKAVHVAGTNGKGSVCAYVSSVCTASRLRTGRFTSPHLIKRWDCICVDDRVVSETEFLRAETHVKSIDAMHAVGATEFELLTAVAFELFKRNNVELAVIEVGLGGALDATNVLQQSQSVICSVITKVGLDHQGFLGNTIGEIAAQKAGIVTPGVPCVVDSTNDPQALHAVELACAGKSELVRAEPVDAVSPLKGAFQASNLSCALEALKIVSRTFPQITPSTISLGIKSTKWAGRLQWFPESRTLLDGAHNEDAARSLAHYINTELRPVNHSLTFIVAFSKGKDTAQILNLLIQPQDKLIATEFGPVDSMPWVEACDPDHIAAQAKGLCGDISTAALPDLIPKLSQLDGVKVVCGSLYLAGQVLSYI